MAEDKFKLPGSSYEEVVKIVKAYGHYDSEVELTEVSQVSALHPTSISRNTGFLVAIAVLEGGQKKVLTATGRNLARALDHDITDEIRSYWKEIALANDFIRKLISAIRIRNGMEPSTLQAHIAYSAGQSKSPKVMTGASTVIEILQIAGLVREVDGKLQAASTEAPESGAVVEVRRPTAPAQTPVRQPTNDTQPSAVGAAPRVNITIQIQLTCTAQDVGELGPKLRALIAEITEQKQEAQDSIASA